MNMGTTTRLNKMESEFSNPIKYFLVHDDYKINMNDFIGSAIEIEFTHNIYCIACGRKVTKTFGQGYCYPCFMSVPQTEECVLRPELCRAHEGIARDMEYAKNHCLQDHFVYLAASPEIKVGVTRKSQIPFRWIDQGADFAVKIALVPNRYTAGLIEVELKKILPDKTNWRKMLSGQIAETTPFQEIFVKIENFISAELKKFLLSEREIVSIKYPVIKYPLKVQTIDFDKEPKISDVLTGIKGQYLLFESGKVVNIRKHSGYEVTIKNNAKN